jgi:metal-dependent hydrolase (beta-lactamase superfamily II)
MARVLSLILALILLKISRMLVLLFGCIDAIVITHSHLDHCADFESILTLLYEYNDQRVKEAEEEGKPAHMRALSIYASMGTLKKCSGWLDLFHGSPTRR